MNVGCLSLTQCDMSMHIPMVQAAYRYQYTRSGVSQLIRTFSLTTSDLGGFYFENGFERVDPETASEPRESGLAFPVSYPAVLRAVSTWSAGLPVYLGACRSHHPLKLHTTTHAHHPTPNEEMAPTSQADFLAALDQRVAQCWCMEPWVDATHVPVQMECCKQLAGTECIKQWVASSAVNNNKCPSVRCAILGSKRFADLVSFRLVSTGAVQKGRHARRLAPPTSYSFNLV